MRRTTLLLTLATAISLVFVLANVALGSTGGKRAATAKLHISIHEHGTNAPTSIRGKFTIELAKTPFGPGGTTSISPDAGNTTYVNGQERIAFGGTDHLTSTKGQIELRLAGIHIELNSKLTPSGWVVGPVVEYGTWKIASATGIYQGWKGGGNWAAALSGYSRFQPYTVEWDGYITQ